MLNIDVTGGLLSVMPVCCDSRAGLGCGGPNGELSLAGAIADAGNDGVGSSPAGVGGIDPVSLPEGVSASRFSSSSRIAPSTLRTILPTVSSRGAASTNFLPTSCTLSINFPGSIALVVDTTFRNSHAVANAQGFGPRICLRRNNAMRYSTDLSTGQDGRFARKVARPGTGRSAAMIEWCKTCHGISCFSMHLYCNNIEYGYAQKGDQVF